jgi:hypothetical protein
MTYALIEQIDASLPAQRAIRCRFHAHFLGQLAMAVHAARPFALERDEARAVVTGPLAAWPPSMSPCEKGLTFS